MTGTVCGWPIPGRLARDGYIKEPMAPPPRPIIFFKSSSSTFSSPLAEISSFNLPTMRALTHFPLLAIAVLVAARSPAIERQYTVSGPGKEETPSSASALSVKEVKRSLAAVERPQRLVPRYSTPSKESEFFFFFFQFILQTERNELCIIHFLFFFRTDSYYLIAFVVNGTAIPDVDFDIRESYAGLLPISQKSNETNQLYFWYFPSQNPLAQDEITIWLNGGPGCSSLAGLLQENGPFLWLPGTFKPVRNPYSWVNLTNMVWVEQPVGTGFSPGKLTTNVEDSTAQFLGFFKNFVDTFDLHHKKIYIAGESFAGKYIPYIADAMLKTNDTEYYNIESILLYDSFLSSEAIQNNGKCDNHFERLV